MNLECGHDEEVGLVCAACAVDVQRALSAAAAKETLEVQRLALLRRQASVWKAFGGSLASYMASRLLPILDADAGRLEELSRGKLLSYQEEQLGEESQEAPEYDPGDKVFRTRRRSAGGAS